MQKIIIAIDGHSSCGKSTVAKTLAKKLNYTYIDTGAMYRCVTLFALRNDIIKDGKIDEDELKKYLPVLKIKLKYNSEIEKSETYLNDENVEDEIRNLEVSNNVSPISKIKFVRERMVELQQEMGKQKEIVMDGRDIGTVVFPNAELKIFMTAKPEVRAMRRYKELTEKGEKVSFEEIKENVISRDFIDENRAESPLKKAEDALILDNSEITREEQFEWILNIINEKFAS